MKKTYTCDWCGETFRRNPVVTTETDHFCDFECKAYYDSLGRLGVTYDDIA